MIINLKINLKIIISTIYKNKIYYLQLEIQKRPFILQIQLQRKVYANSKMPLQYTVISKKIDHDGSGDATVVSRYYL